MRASSNKRHDYGMIIWFMITHFFFNFCFSLFGSCLVLLGLPKDGEGKEFELN